MGLWAVAKGLMRPERLHKGLRRGRAPEKVDDGLRLATELELGFLALLRVPELMVRDRPGGRTPQVPMVVVAAVRRDGAAIDVDVDLGIARAVRGVLDV